MISLRILNKIFIYFIIISLCIGALLFVVLSKPFEIESLKYRQNGSKKDQYFDTIVGRSLRLSPIKTDISLPSIKDSFKIAMIENRPDSINKKTKFEIKFNNSQNIITAFEEEILYLSATDDGSFEFSKKKTPLRVHLKVIDSNNVRVVIKAEMKDFESESSEQNFFDSFIVSASDSSLKSDIDNRFEFKILASAKWWGKDCFLKIYKTDDLKYQKQKVEIEEDIYYLTKNDLLIFKEGGWQIPTEGENTLKYSIAKVKSIDTKILEIEAFDESGNDKFIFAISLQPKGSFSQRSDQLITSARKRTHTLISCLIEKQRMILKKGDILMKKDGRWKFLKKSVNFDDLKSDEIFYLEKIENRNKTNYLIGYLFSPMRTNFQKIEVPISSLSDKKRLKRGNIR